MLFEPPEYNRKMLHHIYNSNVALLSNLQKSVILNEAEEKDLLNLPSTLMICYLNGFEEAIQLLIDAKSILKNYPKTEVFINFKEVMRIVRKIKYNKNNE